MVRAATYSPKKSQHVKSSKDSIKIPPLEDVRAHFPSIYCLRKAVMEGGSKGRKELRRGKGVSKATETISGESKIIIGVLSKSKCRIFCPCDQR